MTRHEIACLRLHNQRLRGAPFPDPVAAVGALGAVQAQDYYGAAWALGQRCEGVTEADVGALFDTGALLRTHVLRSTWHFVRPSDLRWLQALTGPRVHAANASSYRKLELDAATLRRGAALLTDALRDGHHCTRAELADALEAGGIAARGQRLAYLVMHAELDALVCSGPRRGKQFTYALLDERVPPTPPLERDEALAALASRYLATHGPATARDFAWWSGLTAPDARTAFALVRPRFLWETVNGIEYGLPEPSAEAAGRCLHLLPNYDEHVVAYRDHGPSLDPALDGADLNAALAAHLVVRDGLVVGGWRRARSAREATVETTLLVDFDAEEQAALQAAAEGYGRFLGLPVTMRTRA